MEAAVIDMLEAFATIAPHLANPLVLVGFVLLLFFGVHRTLIRSGVLKPVSAAQSGVLIRVLLRYGFLIALLLIVAGFGFAAWKVWIAAGPKVDVNAIVETLTRKFEKELTAGRQREEAAQGQIQQLTEAVTTLARQAEQPQAPPGVTEALQQLAEGNTQAAETIFQDTLARKEAEGQSAIKEAAAAARHLGALAFLHDTKKALAAYRKAVELDPQDSTGWNLLGHLLRRVGEMDEAERAYKMVLALGKRTESREDIAIAYGNLGIVYEIRGELDRAEEMHLKSLEINEALGLKEGMANAYGNLGNVYEAREEMPAACRAWEKSMDLFAEIGVPDEVKLLEGQMAAAACRR